MQAIVIGLFLAVVTAIVVWAFVVVGRAHLRWRRASRGVDATIVRVQHEQGLLAKGYVPEFAVAGDPDDLMRRYLAGEDIPLTWRIRK